MAVHTRHAVHTHTHTSRIHVHVKLGLELTQFPLERVFPPSLTHRDSVRSVLIHLILYIVP